MLGPPARADGHRLHASFRFTPGLRLEVRHEDPVGGLRGQFASAFNYELSGSYSRVNLDRLNLGLPSPTRANNALFAVVDRYMLVHWSGLESTEALALVGHYHASRIVPILFLSVADLLAGAVLLKIALLDGVMKNANEEQSKG